MATKNPTNNQWVHHDKHAAAAKRSGLTRQQAKAVAFGQDYGVDVGAVLADRQKTHGAFDTHAAISQTIKAVYRAQPGWGGLADDMRESLEMNAHKVARILNGDPTVADHWVDIAGYSKLVGDRLAKEKP